LPSFSYRLARFKIRYIIWLVPVVFFGSSIALIDMNILNDVQTGDADFEYLKERRIVLSSVDDYILLLRILFGIIMGVIVFSVIVGVARLQLKHKNRIEA
jgi:hypothetical protein